MQLSILPAEFPPSASFSVARALRSHDVGGDFDFIVADDKSAGRLIAEVSGHGVPAALIASMLKLAATEQRGNAADPSGELRTVPLLYPPAFNSVRTCLAISFSVSKTPTPWNATASTMGSFFLRSSVESISTGKMFGRSRLLSWST